MCVHFFNFDHLRITLQSSDLICGTKFRAPSLPLPPLIFSYLQALIHDFLWWWACSCLIFSLKWHLQSPFLLLHSASINLQEAKDSIDEEDPRPTSSTWSYIMWYQSIFVQIMFFCFLYLFVRSIHFNSMFFILFSMYILHFLVVWCCLEQIQKNKPIKSQIYTCSCISMVQILQIYS